VQKIVTILYKCLKIYTRFYGAFRVFSWLSASLGQLYQSVAKDTIFIVA